MNYDILYDLWKSHTHWWFTSSKEDDLFIAHNYADYLYDNSYEKLEFQEKQLKYWIGVIISKDQLSRNINRVYQLNTIEYTKKILYIITYVTERIADANFYCDSFDFMFSHLPLRHIGGIENYYYCLQNAFKFINIRGHFTINDIALLKRFINATIQRFPFTSDLLQQQTPKQQSQSSLCLYDFNKYNNVAIIDNLSNNIDKTARCIKYISQLKRKVSDDIAVRNLNGLIVSLSGGVDSMLCLELLIQLKLGIPIAAVHINYANRAETNEEMHFIQQWCQFKGILLYSRTILEINRSDMMKIGLRDTYEEYTKKVRFISYQYALNDFCKGLDNALIILGHNQDDMLENIITNIKSNSKLHNLCGMEEFSQQFDISLYRPLLNTPKADIFQAAKYYRLPYLKDTTVSWSSRYKIRTHIVQPLEDFGVVNGLFKHAALCKELTSIAAALVDNTIHQIIIGKGSLCVSADHPLCKSLFFAKELFFKLYNQYFSSKSLNTYITRIEHLANTISTRHCYIKQCIILNKHIQFQVCLTNKNTLINFIFDVSQY